MNIEDIKPFSESEFKKFCDFIYETVGIHLTDKKFSLVNNRLRKRVRHYNFSSYNEYFLWVLNDNQGKAELTELINQITTNVSSFFREPKQLKIFFDEILPNVFEKKTKIKIWSAGCSTGEEPYTLAMILMKFSKLNFEIYATDLSTRVLKYAEAGIYDSDHLKDVDPATLKRFFIEDIALGKYKIRDEVKKNIKFGVLNLIKDKYPTEFDMIFCRNVIIYFDKQTKDGVMQGFHNSLKEDGILFLGHSESLFSNPLFKFYKPSIYLKV
jgi:chemotaxis protein methyltransferase CheR